MKRYDGYLKLIPLIKAREPGDVILNMATIIGLPVGDSFWRDYMTAPGPSDAIALYLVYANDTLPTPHAFSRDKCIELIEEWESRGIV